MGRSFSILERSIIYIEKDKIEDFETYDISETILLR